MSNTLNPNFRFVFKRWQLTIYEPILLKKTSFVDLNGNEALKMLQLLNPLISIGTPQHISLLNHKDTRTHKVPAVSSG